MRGASGSSVHQQAQGTLVSLHKGSAVQQCLFFTPLLKQTCTLPVKVRTNNSAVPRAASNTGGGSGHIVQMEVKDPLLERLHDPPI